MSMSGTMGRSSKRMPSDPALGTTGITARVAIPGIGVGTNDSDAIEHLAGHKRQLSVRLNGLTMEATAPTFASRANRRPRALMIAKAKLLTFCATLAALFVLVVGSAAPAYAHGGHE